MTTRFVIPITAALACTLFIAACESKSAPSKACIEAARLYAEALDTDSRAPEGEKAAEIKSSKGLDCGIRGSENKNVWRVA